MVFWMLLSKVTHKEGKKYPSDMANSNLIVIKELNTIVTINTAVHSSESAEVKVKVQSLPTSQEKKREDRYGGAA